MSLLIKSRELDWLRNEDKSLPVPLVIFEPTERYGGYYLSPFRGEVLIGDRYYDTRSGLIVVSSLCPADIPSTIAHEWRHHWQHYQGWEYDGLNWDDCMGMGYENAIRAYFHFSCSESDALRFQYRKAKNDLADFWRGLLSN